MNNNHRRLASTALSLLLALSSAGPSAWAATARAVPATGAATLGLPALPSALPGLAGTPSVGALSPSAVPASVAPVASLPQTSAALAQTPAGVQAAPAAIVPARPSLEARPTFARVKAFAEAARPEAQASRPSLIGRLASAVAEKLSLGGLFDASRPAPAAGLSGAMGFRPLPRQALPAGVDIDLRDAPTNPLPGQAQQVNIQAFEIPGVRNAGGVFDAGPRVLQADPASEADMERALREAVDLDAARYGVTSAELATVHVRRVEGQAGQADTVYAYFRQQKTSTNTDGTTQKVAVHGSYLSFTVKVVKDKPVLMAAMARLYPSLAVNTGAAMTDAQLKDRAEQQLPQGAGITLEYLERKVIYHEGAWKTVNLYTIEGLPIPIGVLVAVEVATGEVFGWDSRLGVDEAPSAPAPAGSVSGTAAGRAETSDTRPNGQPDLKQVALPHLRVEVAGKAGVTDKEGRFSSTASDQPVAFTATLSGSYAQVNDRAGKPLKVSTTLTPGQDATVVFNPAGQDELTVSQVNAYAATTRVHDWVQARLAKNEARLDRAIPVNVNINQDCNAYYTPGRPSLNFFKSSRRCSDTARPGVVSHEYGHFVDDMIGGIVNGGLSEGWGDILSMYILGSPIIGDGFLKNTTPSYIRHGENDYQYSDNDEVHDQGQAWMGFAWKLRKGLIASLGEAAGAAVAEALVIPTLYAKAADIPAAMAQVLLNDMDKQGNLPHEREIRAAAKAHGVDLPRNPGVIMTLWNGVTSGLRRLTMGAVLTEPSEPGAAMPEAPLGPGALPDAALATPPAATERLARARLTFSAGALIRGQVRREIQKYLDYHAANGLTGELKEYKGLFSSDFLLTLEGPEPLVRHLIEQLQALGSR